MSEACRERLNDAEGWTRGSDASLLPVPVGAYDGGFEDGYPAREVSSVISFILFYSAPKRKKREKRRKKKEIKNVEEVYRSGHGQKSERVRGIGGLCGLGGRRRMFGGLGCRYPRIVVRSPLVLFTFGLFLFFSLVQLGGAWKAMFSKQTILLWRKILYNRKGEKRNGYKITFPVFPAAQTGCRLQRAPDT